MKKLLTLALAALSLTAMASEVVIDKLRQSTTST